MDVSDAGAVAQARAGDRGAFALLVERHSRNIFRLAYRLTGSEHDAEDIVQETFFRAYRDLERFESRAGFNTWLYRIATNYAIDLMRSRRRRASGSGDDERTFEVVSEAPSPERLAYSSQMQERVAAALDDLAPAERTAFVLRHFEGMKSEEIARMLGASATATRHSIHRAVKKLRLALGPAVGVS